MSIPGQSLGPEIVSVSTRKRQLKQGDGSVGEGYDLAVEHLPGIMRPWVLPPVLEMKNLLFV